MVAKGEYVLLRPNRRKDLRADLLVLEVKGEDAKGVFFGYAKNLSKAGMFISSVNPRKMGTEFKICFKLPFEPNNEVSSRCRVTWVREYNPKSNQGPGMGIKFLDLDYKVKEEIENWIKGVIKVDPSKATPMD